MYNAHVRIASRADAEPMDNTQTAPWRALPPVQLLMLLRPHQWVKNAFVAAPLLLTPSAVDGDALVRISLGVLAFSLAASSVYILNDIVDRKADREHPSKRARPLAAGTIPLAVAALAGVAFLAAGIGLAAWLEPTFLAALGIYLALNAAYTLGLKRVSILDVFVIAAGFVVRVEAGSLLADIDLTVWLSIITGLLALFLALAKRRDDVVKELSATHRKSLEGYSKEFLDAAVSVILGALLVAYLVYTTDPAAAERLESDRLYFTAPFVVAGILRYLQIMFVEERSGSPTRLVLTDRFLIATIAGWVATFGVLIYG